MELVEGVGAAGGVHVEDCCQDWLVGGFDIALAARHAVLQPCFRAPDGFGVWQRC